MDVAMATGSRTFHVSDSGVACKERGTGPRGTRETAREKIREQQVPSEMP